MSEVREILEGMQKDRLVDLIIEYSDNGYYPIELFLLKTDYGFSADKIEEFWNNLYNKAAEYEGEKDDKGADLLRDAAELCFSQIQRLFDKEDQLSLCRKIVTDLDCAETQDGIGMNTDSEWIYMEWHDRIQEFIGKITE